MLPLVPTKLLLAPNKQEQLPRHPSPTHLALMLSFFFFFIFMVIWNHDSIVKFLIVESQFYYFQCCWCTKKSWFCSTTSSLQNGITILLCNNNPLHNGIVILFCNILVAQWNLDNVVWNLTLLLYNFFSKINTKWKCDFVLHWNHTSIILSYFNFLAQWNHDFIV